jgi:hypothetical protein
LSFTNSGVSLISFPGDDPEGSAALPPEENNPLIKLLMDVSMSQETLLEDYVLLANRFNIAGWEALRPNCSVAHWDNTLAQSGSDRPASMALCNKL